MNTTTTDLLLIGVGVCRDKQAQVDEPCIALAQSTRVLGWVDFIRGVLPLSDFD